MKELLFLNGIDNKEFLLALIALLGSVCIGLVSPSLKSEVLNMLSATIGGYWGYKQASIIKTEENGNDTDTDTEGGVG